MSFKGIRASDSEPPRCNLGRLVRSASTLLVLTMLLLGAAAPAKKPPPASPKPKPKPAAPAHSAKKPVKPPAAPAKAARTLIVCDRGNLALYSLDAGKTERLTTDGTLFEPYSSPATFDGNEVAMMRGGNVFAFNIKRAALLQITTDGLPPDSGQKWYASPQVSPDGRTIAALFTDNTGDNPVHEVVFFSADGHNRKSIPTDDALEGASLGHLRFAPKGKQVAFNFFTDSEDASGVAAVPVPTGKVKVVYQPQQASGETQTAEDSSFDDFFWLSDSSLLVSLSTYDENFNLSYSPALFTVGGKVARRRIAWPKQTAGSDVVVSPIASTGAAILALRASNLSAVSDANKGTAYFEILELPATGVGAGKTLFSRQQQIADFSSFDGIRLIPGAHLVAVVTSEVKQLGTKGEGALPATKAAAATPAVRQPITFFSALILDFAGKPVANLTDLTDPAILAGK